jgi:hypothetical protein
VTHGAARIRGMAFHWSYSIDWRRNQQTKKEKKKNRTTYIIWLRSLLRIDRSIEQQKLISSSFCFLVSFLIITTFSIPLLLEPASSSSSCLFAILRHRLAVFPSGRVSTERTWRRSQTER